jgi:hypothetical protein
MEPKRGRTVRMSPGWMGRGYAEYSICVWVYVGKKETSPSSGPGRSAGHVMEHRNAAGPVHEFLTVHRPG